jgi:subtilisin-like proprotein convertase family protein
VKDLFKRACDRVDPQGGAYDVSGHSPKYGYGRLNARTVVDLAAPQPRRGTTISRTFDAPIPDLQTVSFTLDVADSTPVEALTVAVDLKHTYIGDLAITLLPPAVTAMNPIVLHNRAGGSTKNLKKTYDAATTPALRAFVGKSCQGVWTLRIQDAAAADSGTLVSVAIGLWFLHPDRDRNR